MAQRSRETFMARRYDEPSAESTLESADDADLNQKVGPTFLERRSPELAELRPRQ
jgi:hypothetical protein